MGKNIMKSDDQHSGEKRPLLAVVAGESARDVSEASRPPQQDGEGAIDNESEEPSGSVGLSEEASEAHEDGPVLSSIAGGKCAAGGISSLGRLTDISTADEVTAAVREWAADVVQLLPVEQVTHRSEAIRLLRAVGVSSAAALADAGMEEATMAMDNVSCGCSGSCPIVGEIEEAMPWPEAVDGRELAAEIEAVFRKHVVLPDAHAFLAIALWVLAAHAHDSFNVFPLLVISTPVLRAGKTTVLMMLSAIVPRPLFTSNITAPALFEAIAAGKRTIIVDEADTFLNGNEALRGVLNSGHVRSLANVTRVRGSYSTWAPKVIALIGRVPRTVEDRSVIIRMERRVANERVERLRLDRLDEFSHLGFKAARWAQDHGEQLGEADPAIPDEIRNDRARDNWRSLLAIADAIGGDLPCRAREAAIALCRGDEMLDEEVETLLLKDMDGLYRSRRTDRLESQEIVRSLVAMPDRPWVDYARGRPLRAIDLARILSTFRIRPQQWAYREGRKRKWQRGYLLSDLRETFARYVPPQQAEPPAAPTNP
jgi:hypothetical protein